LKTFYTNRRRRLSSITRAPCRKVMGVPGQIPMPYGSPPPARQPEHRRFNRFLATLPPHDFSLLAPHLRTIALERGVMLHDVGEEIEHVGRRRGGTAAGGARAAA
jgi:hypothetical protein